MTLASGFSSDPDALHIRTDARVAGTALRAGQTAEYRLEPNRHVYLVPAAGRVSVNGVAASAGDGIAVRDEDLLRITALEDAEVVLVDAG